MNIQQKCNDTCPCDLIPYNCINGVDNISKNFFNKLSKICLDVLNLGADNITNNLDAVIYLLLKGDYYKKILDADVKAAEYLQNNKLYYFYFYDFETKRNYRLSSHDIVLSKNRIFSVEALQKYVELGIWNDNLLKTEPNAFTPIRCTCKPPTNPIRTRKLLYEYEIFTQSGFKQYIKDYPYYTQTKEYLEEYPHNSTLNYPKFSFKTADEFVNNYISVYKNYYRAYSEATYYITIENKINQIKRNIENAKVSYFTVNIPKDLFPALVKNIGTYNSNEIIYIYNLITSSRSLLLSQ